MAVRTPLYNDSGNLKEMSTAMVDQIVQQTVYQYSLNPSVTLSIVGSSGNLGTITFPNETGTVITTGSTDAITESMMGTDSIGQNELKSVVQLIIYNSSGVALKTLYGAGA